MITTSLSGLSTVASSSTLRPEERKVLVNYIFELTAIVLDESKNYLLDSRLGPLAQSLGLRNLFELVDRSRRDTTKSVERKIIDAVTTRETLFFRDNAPFEALRHKIIPELVDRRLRHRAPGSSTPGSNLGGPIPIRVWSAASSSGQELYSVAILLQQLLTGMGDFSFRLIGTDISDEAVASASRGEFRKHEIERGLPPNLLAKFFTPTDIGWKVRDSLRSMVSFKRFNLMHDFSPLGQFDVILCRNVAIYFDEPTKVKLFQRLAKQLDPEGALIIGSMENLPPGVTDYRTERHMNACIFKLAGSTPPPKVPASAPVSNPLGAGPYPPGTTFRR